MPEFTLRPYQREAVDRIWTSIVQSWEVAQTFQLGWQSEDKQLSGESLVQAVK